MNLRKKQSDKRTFSEGCFLLFPPLLIQTNLLSNHSITPLFSSDNGLSPGLLKGVTVDLRGDTGEAISVDKPPENRVMSKRRPGTFLFFDVPREREAKLEVSPTSQQSGG